MRRDYPDRPIVGVGVVVFRGDDALLIRRGTPPRIGQWSLPGGAQELGETVEQAARRELREETAIEAGQLRLIDVVDLITHDDDDASVARHYTLIDFATEWQSSEPDADGAPIAGGDATAVRWVPLAELDRYGMWDETLRVIRLSAGWRPT